MSEEDFQFAGQHDKEEIVLVIHRHWWYFIKPALKILLLVILSIVTIKIWGASKISSPLLALFLVMIFYTIGKNWFTWANTIYLLSDQRIICVVQSGIFNREVSEASLENILMISHKVAGIAGTILNFGTVNIRASGVIEEEIMLSQIADPYDVQQKIIASQRKITEKDNQEEPKKIQENKKESLKEIKDKQEKKDFWNNSSKKKKI